MNQVPQSISVGPLRDFVLKGVGYDPLTLTHRVKAHYEQYEVEQLGATARVYGDLYVVGAGQDYEQALENLIAEINRLTGTAS